MPAFHDLLTTGRTVLSDGAWGTQLRARGLTGSCPELWNVEQPDAVAAVAEAYVAAGSAVILTNSFGGSPFKLAGYGLEERTEEINERAVRLSRRAAGETCVVLASVGPTGKFLAPHGPIAEDAMVKAFRRQIRGLLAGGADGVVIETMSDLGEAMCALRAARAEGAPAVVVSMTFERKRSGMVTMMGVKPVQAAQLFSEEACDAVGANCGTGIDDMVAVMREMADVATIALWAKPNAGLPRLVGNETVYPETPEEMAGKLPLLIEEGATIVGGCCGTTPEHIRLMGARI